jgi:hydroxypyruvate isomerase
MPVGSTARLAQRLEETEARARDQAEEWGQRLQDDERRGERLAAALKTRVAQLEDVATRPLAAEAADLEAVRVLRSQLEASEERRRRLEDYVTRIRQSYAEAFGDKVL